MDRITGLLVTVRTARQGTEMVCGKSTPKYIEEISTLRIHPEDLAFLGLAPNQSALLTSAHGEAIVTCRPTEGPRGIFFLPLGPVANRLFSAAATQGTGVPDWKSLEVTLSRHGAPCEKPTQREVEFDEHSS